MIPEDLSDLDFCLTLDEDALYWWARKAVSDEVRDFCRRETRMSRTPTAADVYAHLARVQDGDA